MRNRWAVCTGRSKHGINGLPAGQVDGGRSGSLGGRATADGYAGVKTILFLLAAIAGLTINPDVAAAQCPSPEGVTLQILGSGGPIADDARASSAYLVWLDGKSRVLVDVGGGAFLRFGEAGARFEDLDHIAISHFHTDHAADFVTLLKTGFFTDRTRPIGVSGPAGGGPFPSLTDYLAANVGGDGAYQYLSGYMDGSGGLVRLEPVELDPSGDEVQAVRFMTDRDITITATGVPHGIVPAIAYRVRVGETEIVFASDQNGNDDRFIEFAKDADVLVMHLVAPEGIEGSFRALHAPPSRIGEIASAANTGKLVLSHLTRWSLPDLDDNVAIVREHFDGEIVLAEDLACIDP